MILLLNRRGYANFTQCRDCGAVRTCPHCNVSLTQHRRPARLVCHHCNHHEPLPEACPDCGSTHDLFGSGGGEGLAASLALPFLGAVPLGLAVRQEGDRGTPTVVGRPDAPEGQALAAIAETVEARVAAVAGSADVP